MALAKDVIVCIWTGLEFTIIPCYRYVRKNPLVAGALVFFFLLYRFLPSVFSFLLDASPVLICTAVILKVLLSLENQNVKKFKDNDNNHVELRRESVVVKDEITANGHENSSMQRRTDISRNAREENTMVFSSSPDNDLICRISIVEENRKGIREMKGNPEFSDEEAEEEDEEENGNKAVEWTEDDEKNLIDLGTSEIERNKRLESLIAKRRARQLLRMQAEKNLIDLDCNNLPCQNQIAPIVVSTRINPFEAQQTLEENDEKPVPGSAPSVLLPTRNPFDIPYDPLEEKPNLMGDSFHQEFMPFHQKDILFCRHESFSLGPSLPSKGDGFSKFRRKSDKDLDGKLAGVQESCEENITLSPASSKRECFLALQFPETIDLHDKETIFNMMEKKRESDKNAKIDELSENQEPKASNFHDTFVDFVLFPKNLAGEMEETYGQVNEPLYDSSPSALSKEEAVFRGNKGGTLTPTFSIASDLQVEVSESGSVLGTISPPIEEEEEKDKENFIIYGERELEKEVTSGSEEMWGASSQLSGSEVEEENELSSVDEKESKSRKEVQEISEEDREEVGFSGEDQNPKDFQVKLVDFDQNFYDDFHKFAEELWKSKSFHPSSESKLPDNSALKEELVAQLCGGGDSTKKEQLTNSSEYTIANIEFENVKATVNVYDEVPKSAEEINLISTIEHGEEKSEKRAEHQTVLELANDVDGSTELKRNDDFKGEFVKPTEEETFTLDNSDPLNKVFSEDLALKVDLNVNDYREDLISAPSYYDEMESMQEPAYPSRNRTDDESVVNDEEDEKNLNSVEVKVGDKTLIFTNQQATHKASKLTEDTSSKFFDATEVVSKPAEQYDCPDVSNAVVSEEAVHEASNLTEDTSSKSFDAAEVVSKPAKPYDCPDVLDIVVPEEEESIPVEVLVEEAGRIYRWDETVVSEKGDGESLGAAEDSKGESLVLELWKPGPLATSKSLEDVQVKSEILTRDDDNSNFPGSSAKEKEDSIPAGLPVEEAGRVHRWDETVVSERGDGESLREAEDSKGETQVLELSKPAPLATSKSIEDIHAKSEILTEDDNSNFPGT